MKYATFKALVSGVLYILVTIATAIAAKGTSDTNFLVILLGFAVLYSVPWICINYPFFDKAMNRVVDFESKIETRWNQKNEERQRTRETQ